MLPQLHFHIDDRSQIGYARRAAGELAAKLGFDTTDAGRLGLAVTESASNILKHAGSGQLLLRALGNDGSGGIELLALDDGPGIADVAASLRDGQSTAGTMGGGLGALLRLSDGFEIYTLPGRGTALRVEVRAKALRTRARAIEWGGLCLAKPGEEVSGDSWAIEPHRDQLTVLMADGLGHGFAAHDAASIATATLRGHPQAEPQALLEAAHAALAHTRGAAVAIARVGASAQRGSFAGIGNISCRVETESGTRRFVSHNGIVGHAIRRIQGFALPFPRGALLILHSDGLATRWDLATYPGLAARHPALIAGVLYRDYYRGRDDVSVVVLRNRGHDFPLE